LCCMTTQSPLEQLTQATQGYQRKRSAQPVRTRNDPERFYRGQLRELIVAMRRDIEREVMPVVRQEKEAYRVMDSAYTRDSWSDRIIEAMDRLITKYTGDLFNAQYRRLAARTVSMADAESTQAFVKSVNKAVGVDLRPMLSSEGMRDYLDVAIADNVNLIKSVSDEYFKRIEQAVLGGVRGGDAPTTIARNIQEATGITFRRAKLIARDQSAKLAGEITERRQTQAGVKYFRWVTSKDERVGSDHRAAARRDVGYGPGVYRWDKPPKEGIPGRATRPNCRCTATPVFEFELPKAKQ
jgi:SPP1 gp7 family putative phage head morphogenesis protein